MKTSLRTLFLTFVFTMLCTAMAFAYNPGQRTIHLLGETLNSDKHPVHLVVTQTIDMREVLTAEAYAKLPAAQQKRTNVRNTMKPMALTPSVSLLPMVTAR